MNAPKPLKTKKCKSCKELFIPFRPLQSVCSPHCAVKAAQTLRENQERKELREAKIRIKTKSQWIKEAQVAFNAYIRARDAGKPCICCGLPLALSAVGGGFDCGHYRSVGSAPHLRFDERNAHGQRKQCNRWGSGRAVDYRIGLINRIGLPAVEALEADQTPKHYTIDDIRQIKRKYQLLAKALEAK